ncbi:MAG: DUF2723 domain-containing protein [Candidatus Zixiibacteriota bacterium]
MKLSTSASFDRPNALVAFAVWLAVVVVYTLTKAPTLSFWDCGEFIAASYILGIPHPPGTPLYILIGRLFSLIPWSSDIAVRLNMLSVISSSFTALFGYLVLVRLLRACFQVDKSTLTRVIVYAGGASGALFSAFSLTNWNNSVETEVYGLSMMMLMAVVWLGLLYYERAGTNAGQRFMLLAFYVAFAGIGVHMTTFLALPAVALLFILKPGTPGRIWLGVGAFVLFELYLIFALSSRPNEIPYYIPVAIALIVYLFYIFSYEKMPTIYLWVAGGLLMSVIPLAGHAVRAISGSSGANSMATALDTLGVIGKVSFVLTAAGGLFLLYRYFKLPRESEARSHFLVSAIFILAAGIMTGIVALNIRGYHIFLLATVIVGIGLFVAIYRYVNWTTLIALACVSTVVLGVWEFFYSLIAGAIVILVAGLVLKRPGWKNALAILLVAVLGYSTHMFIPIRSAHKPMLNENNPSESLEATINFIERKQYGSQSMVERMFERRGEWGNQLGDYRRMGLWRFFKEQYGVTGVRFVPLFVVGLFGIWELLRRRARAGVPFVVLFLLASVGLVLYMNFADGTRQNLATGLDYIEVRDRDYFFTPAYIMFGLAIGLGLASVVHFIRESLQGKSKTVRNYVAGLSLVLFLLPSFTLANNYFLSDRSRDYMPYDYAWNFLISADPNAILVTVGDNDTFPLWCLQEVYHIRQDVDIINMSLANTKWYIKHLVYPMGVDLGWTEGQIDSLVVFRDQFGNIHRLANQVVSAAIKENYGRRPINFLMTVPPSSRKFMGQNIDSLLVMNGQAWRMTRTNGTMTIDVEASIDLLTNPDKFKYRSIADPTIYKSETTLRLTENYAGTFMRVADTLLRAGDYGRAAWLMEKAVEYIPHSTDAITYLASIYADIGQRDKLQRLMETSVYADIKPLTALMARLEMRQGNSGAGENILRQLLQQYPNYRPALEDLMRFYFETRRLDDLRSLLRSWVQRNPDDAEISGLLNNIEKEIRRLDSLKGVNQ